MEVHWGLTSLDELGSRYVCIVLPVMTKNETKDAASVAEFPFVLMILLHHDMTYSSIDFHVRIE